MKSSPILMLLRAHPALVVSIATLALAIGLARSCKKTRPGSAPEVLATFAPATSNLHQTVSRKTPDVAPWRRPMPLTGTNGLPQVVVVFTNLPNPMLIVRVAPDTNAPPSGPYAAWGRLIPCILINCADSSAPNTPFIAIVARDVWWNGELIIPKGTEVHGRVRADRLRDRLVSEGPWMLVWQTGESLSVEADALDREFDFETNFAGPTDGLVGICGEVIRGQTLDELKFFLTTALAGFSQGLQQQSTSVLGIQHIPATARNAALTGTSQMLNSYAQQLLEAIRRDGVVVRVPAGKAFWIYVRQVIDPSKARVGGGRLVAATSAANAAQPVAVSAANPIANTLVESPALAPAPRTTLPRIRGTATTSLQQPQYP
jgi:hypothetical protein